MKLKTVSHSSLSTYEACPRKFYYSYVKKIWPEKIPQAFAVGSGVHKVLAEMYRKKIKKQTLTLDEALKIFADTLKEKPAKWNKNTTEQTLLVKYRSILQTVLNNPLKIDNKEIEPTHVEMFYEVDFINPLTKEKLKPKLRGIIDLLAKPGIIVEHKTSSQKYTPEKILSSHQHIGYFVGYYNIFHKKPTKIIYDVIYKTETPVIDIFEVKLTTTDVNAYFKWVKNILNRIAVDDWKTKPEYLNCRFCPYSNICLDAKA